ncbi:hypothetical protein SPOG_02978 [Schizosaccharomyces cryophilus OY26]|uniref:Uncharacterized protein n=1 Tax=Schizosaccharomyces cryophilus (strain OY26 / ATCC MYA-4695 / CBS 11777 / NBRC 106824 / NRRL Y48691) TaxID=653667 RepID=S9W5E4_SCHCR|nr:uncharacterized protein SPOG_02978 [Schizosaccharomyces cryophilus OY26]EPY53789.1 hypothetical protein SPOG_02978 [Schizosaccharomyces cryophilus OY26]
MMTDSRALVSEKEMTVQKLSFISKEELWKLMSKGHIDIKEQQNILCDLPLNTKEEKHSCELSPVLAQHVSYPVGNMEHPQMNFQSLPVSPISPYDFKTQASLLQQQQAKLTAIQTSLERVNLELTAVTERLILIQYRNTSGSNLFSFTKNLASFFRPFIFCLKLLLKNCIVILAACYFMKSSSSAWILNCIRHVYLLLRRLTNPASSPRSFISSGF